MTRERITATLPFLAGLILIAAVSGGGSLYWQQVGALICVYAIAVLGFDLLLGQTGLLSFGHAAFVGLGAFGYAFFARHIPSLLAVGVALLLTAVAALLIGLLTLRFAHAYLAIATFAVAEILRNVAHEWDPVTGGVFGTIVAPLNLFGWQVSGAESTFVLGGVLVLAGVLVHQAIYRSPVGRAMRAIRDDDLTAAAMGVRVFEVKLVAFIAASMFAGVAGIVYGLALSYLDATIFSVEVSVLVLAMLVVGGLGRAWGAVIGAIVIYLIPELLRFVADSWELAYGLILIAAVLAGRNGIVGWAGQAWELITSRRRAAEESAEIGLPTPAEVAANLARHEQREAGSLVVSGVTKHFGGLAALADIDIEFVGGRVQALIGPNGSGKSTLVNCITGIYTPTAGTITLDGESLGGQRSSNVARTGLARTFQSARIFSSMTVRENVLPTIEARGLRGREARERAAELLDLVGLAPVADEPVESLPHGHRRRLEVARALGLEPRFLLLDEPAAGLSAEETAALGDLLTQLAGRGLGVVLIEHNMPFILGVASTMTVLEQGRVIASGPTQEVVKDEAVQRAYLGSDAEAIGTLVDGGDALMDRN